MFLGVFIESVLRPMDADRTRVPAPNGREDQGAEDFDSVHEHLEIRDPVTGVLVFILQRLKAEKS